MSNLSPNPEFEALLEFVKRNRGFDFTGYKRSSLMRRVKKRMQMVNIEDSYSDYQDYLQVHPDEFLYLFNTLLINVTSFFRDRPAWDYIASEIIHQIAVRKESGEQLRVWSVGCASGQEAYTVAMAIADVIGIKQFQERVKIYATDVDEEALSYARQAIYLERELDGLTQSEIDQYFEKSERHYMFRKDLRRSVIFGRHDLVQDAPISRIDLLICRNTLMYFNAETQSRILARFHFALRENGFIFLGKAEMLLIQTNTFTSIDLKHRVFSKVPKLNLRDRLLTMAETGNNDAANFRSNHARLRDAAFDSEPLARLIIDGSGLLALANEQMRLLFKLSVRDIGRPLQDLEVSYRPVELRSCIDQVYRDRRAVNVCDVQFVSPQGEMMCLDVQISPLLDGNNHLLGVSISFIDVTRYKHLQEELDHSNQELEMAHEELQSTHEELETTKEELQSSNEELETTNEELQSTNEELATMNEELQSTNEDLQTVNDELQRRSEELNQSNTFLESILTSLKRGVVVIDRHLQVQIWNYKSEDLWGLRGDEAIGQNFLNLDIGLPIEPLCQPIRDCLSDLPSDFSEIVLGATNRRGKRIQCSVVCTPLLGLQRQVDGVILLMEERNDSEVGMD